jgi:hypothetical protein
MIEDSLGFHRYWTYPAPVHQCEASSGLRVPVHTLLVVHKASWQERVFAFVLIDDCERGAQFELPFFGDQTLGHSEMPRELHSWVQIPQLLPRVQI